MNRKERLDRLVKGPIKKIVFGNILTWHFEHRVAGNLYRRMFLHFSGETRTLYADPGCLHRVSKRRKREIVVLSKGMQAYLRTRLPPEEVAACTRAAIEASIRDPDDIPF